MTKTERWYAIVEELRASSPRPRSARTIERDLDGLLQAGVPHYTQAGRSGGWILDSHATFAAPSLDAAEIFVLAINARAGAGRISEPPRYSESRADCTDLEIGWQIAPRFWGKGYGGEAGHGVAHQAFESGAAAELFAVVRPGDRRRTATARRVGMEWVGETGKYYDMTLQIYRLTKADLDYPELGSPSGHK